MSKASKIKNYIFGKLFTDGEFISYIAILVMIVAICYQSGTSILSGVLLYICIALITLNIEEADDNAMYRKKLTKIYKWKWLGVIALAFVTAFTWK